MSIDLFSTLTLGPRGPAKRVAIAPPTCNRAPEGMPGQLVGEDYRRRCAPAGLTVSERAQVSGQAIAYPLPGET